MWHESKIAQKKFDLTMWWFEIGLCPFKKLLFSDALPSARHLNNDPLFYLLQQFLECWTEK